MNIDPHRSEFLVGVGQDLMRLSKGEKKVQSELKGLRSDKQLMSQLARLKGIEPSKTELARMDKKIQEKEKLLETYASKISVGKRLLDAAKSKQLDPKFYRIHSKNTSGLINAIAEPPMQKKMALSSTRKGVANVQNRPSVSVKSAAKAASLTQSQAITDLNNLMDVFSPPGNGVDQRKLFPVHLGRLPAGSSLADIKNRLAHMKETIERAKTIIVNN